MNRDTLRFAEHELVIAKKRRKLAGIERFRLNPDTICPKRAETRYVHNNVIRAPAGKFDFVTCKREFNGFYWQ